MASTYYAMNGPKVTTAAFLPVTTGTAIKTLMQIATPATKGIKVIEWGISFDGIAVTQPIKCELIQTDVAATVTAYGAGDIVSHNAPNDEGSLMTLGTTSSGFTASAEGTITATRMIDAQLVSPTSGYFKQNPLGYLGSIPISKFLRVRVTATIAVNATCYIIWEE